VLLADLVATSAAVTATSKRLEKVALVAAALRRLAPDEVVPGVAYLSGELRQRQVGVGWAALKDHPPPAAEAQLTIADVDTALERIGLTTGAGSQARRRALIAGLFERAVAEEQEFLVRLLLGDLRQGALAGVMTDAVAKAAEVPATAVRRAVLLRGDLRAVAVAALTEGQEGLTAFRLEVGRPLAPMLAQTAASVDDALAAVCPAAVEWKLDGVRVQVHRQGDDVAVFTRSLDDITARVPEVVTAVRGLAAESLVLDGEVIALDETGRPRPFQVTSSRVGRRGDPVALSREVPLSTAFFDVLHRDGEDLLDAPGAQRFAALEAVVPEYLRIRRTVAHDAATAQAAYAEAIAAGHEGVVVKSLDTTYEAGRRGGGWMKVKPRHTLDLVVLAAEWGHGRLRGWLSNLHLGARDPDSGEFVMVGKTFKGLTDATLAWQTERFLELETHREGITVFVRPAVVAEIALDGVQTSTRYPGGVALRFARLKTYRPDKNPSDADTIHSIRALLGSSSSAVEEPE
jgi:DNA ligase-1